VLHYLEGSEHSSDLLGIAPIEHHVRTFRYTAERFLELVDRAVLGTFHLEVPYRCSSLAPLVDTAIAYNNQR